MGHLTARALALLLVTLALGFCVPGGAAAEAPAAPLRVADADRAHPTSCDAAGGDELGLPTPKTLHAAATVRVEHATRDPMPAATVSPPSTGCASRISRDVPVSRAPPLV